LNTTKNDSRQDSTPAGRKRSRLSSELLPGDGYPERIRKYNEPGTLLLGELDELKISYCYFF